LSAALAKDISSQAKYRAAKTTKVVITTIMLSPVKPIAQRSLSDPLIPLFAIIK
jgi:hypothetical protein